MRYRGGNDRSSVSEARQDKGAGGNDRARADADRPRGDCRQRDPGDQRRLHCNQDSGEHHSVPHHQGEMRCRGGKQQHDDQQHPNQARRQGTHSPRPALLDAIIQTAQGPEDRVVVFVIRPQLNPIGL